LRRFRKRVVRLVSTVPDFFGIVCLRIAEPDRPGSDAERDERKLGLESWKPNKCDLFSIRGPARQDVAIGARREISYCSFSKMIDGDETVISAVGSKRYFATIGRPSGRCVVARQVS